MNDFLVLSFIVPAYNEEFELPRTLRAIKAAMSAADPYEIIVADDASTDRTAEIAKNEGARVVSINRRQIAAARNAGARASRGEILFFIDADTRIDADHISKSLDVLRAGCSGGSARVAMEGAIPPWAQLVLRLFSAVYFGSNLGAGAFLFTTRRHYDAVGGFDERYFAGEEVWFSLALKKLGPFKVLDEPVRTSGRKLRMYSSWQLWCRMTRLLLGGFRPQPRNRLDLWYDGKREREAS